MKKRVLITVFMWLLMTINLTIIVSANEPPNPPIITGPTIGNIKEPYIYNITLTDPDLDDVMLNLEVNFGDGTAHIDCGCGQAWQNGTIITVHHTWKKSGEYGILARVQDVSGEWSKWSKPLAISMSKNKSNVNLFLVKFIEQHLYFSQIIRQLFKI
jgi:hypothetical protein